MKQITRLHPKVTKVQNHLHFLMKCDEMARCGFMRSRSDENCFTFLPCSTCCYHQIKYISDVASSIQINFLFCFVVLRPHKRDLNPLLIFSQVDFEAAAQSVMTETLREVKRLRPKALWGFSPYPSCYNSDRAQTMLANYTGQCPPTEMALNDELSWLWKRSSALYPLLTLKKLQVGKRSHECFFGGAGSKST